MISGSSAQMWGVEPLGHRLPDQARPDPSASVERLTGIWQRVFDRPSLTPDDNFFDLGGHPRLACELFDEIRRVGGRELLPSVIYDAPTIAALAELLDRPAPPPLSPLLLLKPGTGKPPVFFAHGLAGSALEFFDLVKHIRTSRAIYGLQAKGSDGAHPPFTHIEGMARFHLKAIRSVQRHGPYTLIGYSLGGLIALEVAGRLLKAGEKIATLTLIDSYPHTGPRGFWKRAHSAGTELRHRAGDLMRLSADKSRRVPLRSVIERRRFSDFLAWTRYRPQVYSGKINFVRAADSLYPDPVPAWSRFATDFEVETAPGDHHTVLSVHFADLAVPLTRHLKSAP